MRLTDDQKKVIFERALKNKLAYIFDLDFSAEDIIFNVKKAIPKLEIEFIERDFCDGDEVDKVKINDKEYVYKIESETRIFDIITDINKHLFLLNKSFIFYKNKGEEYCFILINLFDLSKYVDQGFVSL